MKKLCVFCGSNFGKEEDYLEKTKALGQAIASRGIDLVYGGGNVGLMGELARSVLSAGGKVIGVIPEKIHKMVKHVDISELIITKGMHERKSKMYDIADGFIALPGGIGTFEEFFEAFTWLQLGYHQKPVGLFNINGFYSPLLDFLEKTAEQGFVKKGLLDQLIIGDDPKIILDKAEAFVYKELSKFF